MYKIKTYGAAGKVLSIDGKFVCAIMEGVDVSGLLKSDDVYYIHEGTMRKSHLHHNLTFEEEVLLREGKIQQVLASRDYLRYTCPRIKFIEKFKRMWQKSKCTIVEVGHDGAVLTHFKSNNTIYTNDNTHVINEKLDISQRTMLTYMFKKFTYSTGRNIVFDGYPDMNDSSEVMNFMLAMGNVQDLKKCTALFEMYTKRMDIQY